MNSAVAKPQPADESEVIDVLVRRGRAAMAAFADADQARTDEAVTALAWSIYKPEHARELAEMAVADTGLGNVADKITKNTRKTFGTLRDLSRGPFRGHHRGVSRAWHRQVRQACRRGGSGNAVHQPGSDTGEQGHDGHQGPQRHHHRALTRRTRNDHPHG